MIFQIISSELLALHSSGRKDLKVALRAAFENEIKMVKSSDFSFIDKQVKIKHLKSEYKSQLAKLNASLF